MNAFLRQLKFLAIGRVQTDKNLAEFRRDMEQLQAHLSASDVKLAQLDPRLSTMLLDQILDHLRESQADLAERISSLSERLDHLDSRLKAREDEASSA